MCTFSINITFICMYYVHAVNSVNNRHVVRLCVLTMMPNGWRIEIMTTGNGNITITEIIAAVI